MNNGNIEEANKNLTKREKQLCLSFLQTKDVIVLFDLKFLTINQNFFCFSRFGSSQKSCLQCRLLLKIQFLPLFSNRLNTKGIYHKVNWFGSRMLSIKTDGLQTQGRNCIFYVFQDLSLDINRAEIKNWNYCCQEQSANTLSSFSRFVLISKTKRKRIWANICFSCPILKWHKRRTQ